MWTSKPRFILALTISWTISAAPLWCEPLEQERPPAQVLPGPTGEADEVPLDVTVVQDHDERVTVTSWVPVTPLLSVDGEDDWQWRMPDACYSTLAECRQKVNDACSIYGGTSQNPRKAAKLKMCRDARGDYVCCEGGCRDGQTVTCGPSGRG